MILSILFMYLGGLIVFFSFREHLLMVLFSLEYLVIMMFLCFFLYLLNFGFDLYFVLFFLVFSVCEGSLGLGILVSLIRSHGNDLMMNLSIMSW
uniref:NADH-ubiquinone oxidoreductase chain 4L n=1 Tax=Harmostica fulvicornis TaxID=2813413 RepID=A0A8T9W281_9HEMI|nr:NADH dehydrogenase subunit 4L [Harmostica fulvicornis]UPI55334.1 NADH dehydrogenase subunit 4L [Harmostica fulvicornis]